MTRLKLAVYHATVQYKVLYCHPNRLHLASSPSANTAIMANSILSLYVAGWGIACISQDGLAVESKLTTVKKSGLLLKFLYLNCKIRLAVLSSPAGMSLTKLSLAWNKLFNPGKGESLVSDIPGGDRKIANLFYSVLYVQDLWLGVGEFFQFWIDLYVVSHACNFL